MRTEWRGGTLAHRIRARVRGRWFDKNLGGTMRVENPSKATVRTELGDVALQGVCYQLSRFAQFDGSGMPTVSGSATKRFGAMAIASPSTARIWNWRTNVADGKQKFTTDQAAVVTYVAAERANHIDLPELSAAQAELAWFQKFDNGTKGIKWRRRPRARTRPRATSCGRRCGTGFAT